MKLRYAALLTSVLCGCAGVVAAQGVPEASGVFNRQGQYFSVGSDTIFYQVTGSGPAVLLIHGFPLSGALFGPERAGLSRKAMVITVDLPGFGQSTTGTTSQTDATYAADMIALLGHLGVSKAVIGGHSMGGQVVLEMYKESPQLFAGMILFDTNPAPANLIEKGEWPGFANQAATFGTISLAPAVEPVMVTGTYLAAHPAAMATLRQIVQQGTVAGVQGGANALAHRTNYTPMLGSIAVPALVVEGADDTVYPQAIAVATKQAIPGSELLLVPAAGHASMFQKPEVVNQGILEWAQGAGLLN